MQEFVTLTVSPENDLPPLCPKHESRSCPFSPQPQGNAGAVFPLLSVALPTSAQTSDRLEMNLETRKVRHAVR